MNYVSKSEHYRMFPKVGSEHRRRMAANHAAAETLLRPSITNVCAKSASDFARGQMVL